MTDFVCEGPVGCVGCVGCVCSGCCASSELEELEELELDSCFSTTGSGSGSGTGSGSGSAPGIFSVQSASLTSPAVTTIGKSPGLFGVNVTVCVPSSFSMYWRSKPSPPAIET